MSLKHRLAKRSLAPCEPHKRILSLLLFPLILSIPPAPQQPILTVPVAEAAELPKEVTWTKDSLVALALSEAKRNGLNTDHFVETLEDESDGWQNIQSNVPDSSGPNGLEDSWGICQIHLPDHPDITKEQALDPAFCIPWAAEQWNAGRYRQWHSYEKLLEKGWPNT